MRPPDPPAVRAAKREALRELVLPIAARLWRDVEGGPTLEQVAERTHYSADGLGKALRRAGLGWGTLKEEARRQAASKWAFLSVDVA